MATLKLETIASWSEPKRVETRQGPRDLRTAPAESKFWNTWRANKPALKEAGISCKKLTDGSWEAQWWAQIEESEQQSLTDSRDASRATDANIEIPAPEGCEYMPFQRAGVAYALQRKATLIGDEMGLGKTVQAMGMINATEVKKVLVVCPASLRLNWQKELAKWLTKDLSVSVIEGGKPENWKPADITIINYDVCTKHRRAIDNHGPYDLLVIDECQYLRNDTQRTTAVYGKKTKQKTIEGIKADRVLALSGTPLVNRPRELFTLLQYVGDPLGKNFFAFAKKYCGAKQVWTGHRSVWDFTGSSNLDLLQRQLRERLMVRRLKKDVLKELPAKIRQTIEIPANGCAQLVKKEQEIIGKYRESLEKFLDGQGTLPAPILEEMSEARHGTALAKVPKVIEHLESSLEEGPIVCFAHHRDVIQRIQDHFADKCVVVTGATSLKDRDKAVEDFQNGKVDLFLGNIQAAGVGITLTRSSHVVFAELDWVPGNISQAEDRCHRISQTSSVLVQHLVLEDSLDALLAAALVSKQRVLDQALDTQVEEQVVQKPIQEVKVEEPKKLKDVTLPPEITDEQREAVHLGVKILAGVCDGANALDGQGFNKLDSSFGHSLAHQPFLTDKQVKAAAKMLRKYHRQLPETVLEVL